MKEFFYALLTLVAVMAFSQLMTADGYEPTGAPPLIGAVSSRVAADEPAPKIVEAGSELSAEPVAHP